MSWDAALRDQDIVILQNAYVQRLFKHKRGLVAAYKKAGFELVCLHDGTTTVCCSPKSVCTKLIDMFSNLVAGKIGCVAVKRRSGLRSSRKSRNILIDLIAIINVIGEGSKYRFCAFFDADNIVAVHADPFHVIVDIDTESG